DDHGAGMDADSHREPDTELALEARVERADRVDDVEPGADAALDVELVGTRVAEVGEHTVAEVLRNVALVAAGDAGARGLGRADDGPEIFGVELLGELRRLGQVAEHDRELPPLAAVRGRLRPETSATLGAEARFGTIRVVAGGAPHPVVSGTFLVSGPTTRQRLRRLIAVSAAFERASMAHPLSVCASSETGARLRTAIPTCMDVPRCVSRRAPSMPFPRARCPPRAATTWARCPCSSRSPGRPAPAPRSRAAYSTGPRGSASSRRGSRRRRAAASPTGSP